jgi:2-C-methyl-D-erythritol 4-phosphate cytidylyltransferase
LIFARDSVEIRPMTSAIIVAAGRGTRMGPNVDKLFLEVAGRTVIAHTWLRFDACSEIDEIIVVVRAGLEDAFKDIATTLPLKKPWRAVAGGAERQDSVWNGLQAVSPRFDLVAIQDGARPCTTNQMIHDTLAAARETGAAVAAQRVTDTIKESKDGALITRNVDRSHLWSVQTPQCFRLDVIRKALEAVRRKGIVVTDDTAACELIDQPVKLVPSATPNPKVTVPADLPYIDLLLKQPLA